MKKKIEVFEMTKRDLEFFNRVLNGDAKITDNHRSRTKLFKFVSSYADYICVDKENNAWLIHLGDGDFVVFRTDKYWLYDNGYRYIGGARRLRELPNLI